MSRCPLYVWNAHILKLGLQLSPHGTPPDPGPRQIPDEPEADVRDIPSLTARRFAGVGERPGNEPCAAAIHRLNDRLHLARLQEGRLFDDADQALRHLADPLA